MRHLVVLLLLLVCTCCLHGQDQTDPTDKVVNFPGKFFSRIRQKTADLDASLTRQTEKYLSHLAKKEDKLRKKIARTDSAAAASLPPNNYTSLLQKLKTDSARTIASAGEYLPGIDTLKGGLSFLNEHSQLLGSNPVLNAQMQQSLNQFNQLQAKMADADAIKQYVHERQAQIRGYLLSRFTTIPPGLNSQVQGMQQDMYYYSTEVKQYKEMLNDPDALTEKALAILQKLPAFQNYMHTNGQLGSLFSLPGNYNSAQALEGLQNKDQVAGLLLGQFSGGAGDPMSLIQQNVQAGQGQLDNLKSKLSVLGGGSADMDMPNFKPQQVKTKTFLKRLEYSTDLQTTSTSYYYPTTTDIGLSVGYRLTDKGTLGVGGSFKLGWGNGFQHIALSGQGAGLRSFFDYKMGKAGFSLSGGMEYNYQQAYTSLRQINNLNTWNQSGLIGVSKTVSVKSTLFKKTKAQLLWDFLSYRQMPVTQPFKFRIGYSF